jgi:phosphatidate phosphatase APP1
LFTGGADDADGKTVVCTSGDDSFPDLTGNIHFAGSEGWGVISDIDDTVKVTMTTSPVGILQTTLADVPKTTPGMPEFYKVLDESLKGPAWFYLSASPYNLYPFLRDFLAENYPPGTKILRDASWMSLAGLLQSFTVGVKDYKTSRIEKIHTWLPQRKFICIGDSTQSDPEAYAEMYTKYPDWIQAIYIRKVTDAPNMEAKNKPQRFRDAFKDVPDSVWRVFVDPKELADHLKHVVGSAHEGILGSMLSV